MLARGIDVPEADVVINYEVPYIKSGNEIHGDTDTYLYRIGRAGRFGV
jgi:superfamily II DNA/RNA helicase